MEQEAVPFSYIHLADALVFSVILITNLKELCCLGRGMRSECFLVATGM